MPSRRIRHADYFFSSLSLNAAGSSSSSAAAVADIGDVTKLFLKDVAVLKSKRQRVRNAHPINLQKFDSKLKFSTQTRKV